MTAALQRRSSRVVWSWCVAYTAMLPGELRTRRRAELRSHLWDSEQAGHRGRSIVRAALAGAADDVSWAVARAVAGSVGRVVRSFLTPTPYLVLALAAVVQGAFYWGNQSGSAHRVGTGISEGIAFGCLALAGITYLSARRRH